MENASKEVLHEIGNVKGIALTVLILVAGILIHLVFRDMIFT